jgi:hypothetical protein
MDVENLGAKKVIVVTDRNVDLLPPMQQVREALEERGIDFEVFNDVHVEPKDTSVKAAIEFSRPIQPDLFLAVGGMPRYFKKKRTKLRLTQIRWICDRYGKADESVYMLP